MRPPPVMEGEKAALRREMKDCLTRLPEERFWEAGFKAAHRVPSSSLWRKFSTILLFMSMKTEIDTLPLLEAGLEDGKKIFLPRIEAGKDKKIVFYRVRNSGEWTIDPDNKKPFTIAEPFPTEPLESGDFPALIFTPGLAFDRWGNRLGRGGGFYDRFFAGLEGREFEAAALCLGIQLVPQVPVEKWDRKINCLYTEPDFARLPVEPGFQRM